MAVGSRQVPHEVANFLMLPDRVNPQRGNLPKQAMMGKSWGP